jgi:phospholipid/cholesterol/gamma-HCH transport system substrate-binding protein
MKNTNTQKIRLGLFVIISTILFVLAVYLIGQKQSMFQKTFTISAFFQNVNGLQKGNNVRYSGINIGTVKAIEMFNDSTIKIDMTIDDKIISHIKKNAIATIGSDGLVGNMIVNIIPGKGIDSAVIDGDIIESYSKIGPDDILNTLSVSSENAAILTSDLIKITNSMIKGKGTFGVLLNDTLMAKDLKQTIANLRIASYTANKTMKDMNDLVSNILKDDQSVLGMILNDTLTSKKLRNMVANLESSSMEIDSTLNQINSVISTIQSSEGAFNYIVKDTALVNSLRSTMDNINEGTDKFNQNMEALKHNFLTRSYFRKLEKEKEKEERKKAKNN